MKNCHIISVRCFNKGFLIKLGQLYFKQSSATRNKCLPQLPYAHSRVMSRGRKRIWPSFLPKGRGLTVDENWHARGRKRIWPSFVPKGRGLTVDENWRARPGRFYPPPLPGKETRYPLNRSMGGSGRVRKTSPPPGFNPRTVRFVASPYNDYTIPDEVLYTNIKQSADYGQLRLHLPRECWLNTSSVFEYQP
jgi:hypothetical protein